MLYGPLFKLGLSEEVKISKVEIVDRLESVHNSKFVMAMIMFSSN